MTTSGNYFNFENPDPDSFTIDDIAYALSNICRYGGHCKPFYSVAQHSVYVSKIVQPVYALHGLLHDAQEAFVGDIPSPLKRMLPEYHVIEKRAEEVIAEKFNITWDKDNKKFVKHADLIALRTERELLLPKGTEGDAWWWVIEQGIELSDEPIVPLYSDEAEESFMERFIELTEEDYG